MRLINLLSIGVLLLLASAVQAQQTPRLTQYYNNEFFFNAAGSNIERNMEGTIGYRKEWMNIEDSPRTLLMNFAIDLDRLRARKVRKFDLKHYKIHSTKRIRKIREKPRQMVGFRMFADKYGLFETSTFNLTYSVHIPISRALIMAVGMGAGVRQFNFDSGGAILSDNVDPTFTNFLILSEQKYSLDLNAGIMIYGRNLRFGYSLNEISDRIFGSSDIETTNVVSRDAMTIQHVFLGSYRYELNERISLTPNFMAMYQEQTPFVFNGGVTATYEDQIWLSAIYRSAQAIALGSGFVYQGRFTIGYSYDLTFGRYGGFGNGSHELILGFRMD